MELVRSLGIRAKIILPLAGVAILVAIVGFALIQCAETRQLDRHMTDRSAAIAHAIANVAETVNDSADLQRIVTVMSAEPGVELIVVVAGDPMTVVAASRADWIGLNVFELPGAHRTQVELDRALEVNRPCLDLHHDDLDTIAYTLALQTRLRQNHVLHSAPGAVMLHLDARAIRREQRAESTLLVLALLWTIFVAGLVAYVLLKIVVLRPVEAISRVALSTVIGGTGARVNSRRSDELGQLANRFDIMLDELNRRERQQQDIWKQALEAKLETEEALAQLQNHKQALDEHAIVAITNRIGVITYVNDKFCEIAKYSREESIGQTHRLINSGYHPKSFWVEMWHHIGRGEVWRNEVCNRAKDGSIYWVDTTIVPLKDATGRITQYAAIRTDITQRKAVEAALRESKEQFELAVRGSNDGIWDWNIQTGEVFYSRRFNELIGYEEGELASRFDSFQSHLHPDDIQETLNALQNHLDQSAPYDTVFRLRTKTSNWRWFRARGEAVRTEDGKARRMAGSISDITSLKEVEQELTRAALVDKLTGLPNRGLLQDRVQQAMKRAKRSGRHHYAVMFLDFDRFKIINDSLGHDVGDALLRNIADRLREHIRGVDSVCLEAIGHTTARLGGDEFVVLLDEMSGADDVKLVADRLLNALSQPYQLGNHEVHSTAEHRYCCRRCIV